MAKDTPDNTENQTLGGAADEVASEAPGEAASEAADAAAKPQLAVLGQYVKDLSFENPRAPKSLAQSQEQPRGDIGIQVKNRSLGDNKYEIVLEFNIKANVGENVAFILELTYGGVFTVRGFDENNTRLALWVECPRILFPFARRIIADSMRDGGFAPLMLGPIDFLRLYQERGVADSGDAAAQPTEPTQAAQPAEPTQEATDA